MPVSAGVFFAAVGRASRTNRCDRGARLGRCACGRGHGGNRIFVRLGDGELVKFLRHCYRCTRARTDTAVVFVLIGIAWEVVANSCDIRKDLSKAAVNALPLVLLFGRPAIVLDIIRYKSTSQRTPEARPPSRSDMASMRAD